MSIIFRLLITALALLACAYLVPGIEVTSFFVAVVAAMVLGLLNLIVRPVLIILTLPVTLLTLGLFIFIINAILFFFAASVVSGFVVDGFVPALIGSIVVSLISALGNRFIK